MELSRLTKSNRPVRAMRSAAPTNVDLSYEAPERTVDVDQILVAYAAEPGSPSHDATIVAAIFGLGGVASMIGFLLAGRATLCAGAWQGWRRFTPLAPCVWLAVMIFPETLLHGMVSVYGLCLLAMAVALYTQPASAATVGSGRLAELAVE